MAKGSQTRRGRAKSISKPKKPYPGFPLFAHATKRWAKKIRGKFHYFGPWDDPDGALQKYLDQRDDLHAGRRPRGGGEGFQLRDLVNRFLTNKKNRVDSGELHPRTFASLYATCERLITHLGKTRLVDDLASDDFEELRAALAARFEPQTLSAEIYRIRGVFRYALEAGLIQQPVRFGAEFTPPSRTVIRKARRPRMLEADEIRTLLDAAGVQLKAMIHLGVNCGYGNHDVGTLPISAIDLDRGWVSHPRPKTGIERRAPLWPETRNAIRDVLAQRVEPENADDADLLFITQYRRNRWVRFKPKSSKSVDDNPGETDAEKVLRKKKGVWVDSVGTEFGKLLRKTGVKRERLNFYALRHVAETIGGECRDQVAVDHIMGHVRDDMASVYRERISDERLRDVTDHMHKWLFGQ